MGRLSENCPGFVAHRARRCQIPSADSLAYLSKPSERRWATIVDRTFERPDTPQDTSPSYVREGSGIRGLSISEPAGVVSLISGRVRPVVAGVT